MGIGFHGRCLAESTSLVCLSVVDAFDAILVRETEIREGVTRENGYKSRITCHVTTNPLDAFAVDLNH